LAGSKNLHHLDSHLSKCIVYHTTHTRKTGIPLDESHQVLRRLIVLEGIDGAGTTTQARMLEKRIHSVGAAAWLTSEPTTGPIGQLLRAVLGGSVRASPETVAYLFAADRSEHVFGHDGILSHHDAGEVVVCDRYLYSSLAYQTVDVDESLVMTLNRPFPLAALLVFIDLPVSVSAERLSRRHDREIYENEAVQHRVRENYLRVIERARGNSSVVILDGKRPPREIAEKIWESVERASIV
jgi:dTMP kinase